MMMIKFLMLLCLLGLAPYSEGFFLTVTNDQEIEVISNPHASKVIGCQASLDSFLEPYHLILQPMVTQADTFQELKHAKVMSIPVPIYRVKQPARLSEQQLEFQLVLVKELTTKAQAIVKEVQVPMDKAKDSWFPGYYWSPLIVQCGEGGWQHVGWKFTALDENQGMPHFYALMVQIDENKEAEGLRIGGFKAPGWMIGAILS
jgi:hypothetical protein